MPLRIKIGLVIGAVMFGLGAFLALRPLWSPEPKTGSRLLDLAFATFFLIRGWLYLREAWRRPRPSSASPTVPPTASPPQDGD